MKKTVSGVFLAVACAQSSIAGAVSISDDFEVLGNVGVLSEYSMRGLSYTQRKPAVQGGATVAHSSGAYAGVWGSNVDINGIDARHEMDYFVGFQHALTDDVSFDLGHIKYTFPKGTVLNARETYLVVTAYGFKVGAYYSDDTFDEESALYTYVGYGIKDLPWGLGLDVRYGVADFKDPVFFSSNGSSKESYREWEVKLSKQWLSLDWSASYVDTNLTNSECLSFQGDKESCSARLVFGGAKSF